MLAIVEAEKMRIGAGRRRPSSEGVKRDLKVQAE